MKKNLLTLFTSLFTLVGLAACSPNTATKKISIWATADEEAVIKKVVDNYNKTASEKIEYTFTAVAEGDCGTTLSKDPTVEGAPALFLCADDHIYNLQSKNIISEISGNYKKTIEENITETAIVSSTYKDKLYGFPVTNDNGYFLWYDSSALTDDDVKSLETILNKCASTKKTFLMDVPNGWYVNSFFQAPQACGVDSLTWEAGADGKVKYTTTWDNDQGVKVAQHINSILQPKYTDGTLVTGSNDAILAGFQKKEMIAAVSGTWMETGLKAACPSIKAVKLPSFKIDETDYQMATFTGAKLYCINKTRPVDEQKTAAKLAELLTNKESQLVRFETRSTIPSDKEALKDTRYTSKVTIGAKALDDQVNAAAAIQSKTAEGSYWDVGKAIGQALIDGKLTDDATKTVTWKDFLTGQLAPLRVGK